MEKNTGDSAAASKWDAKPQQEALPEPLIGTGAPDVVPGRTEGSANDELQNGAVDLEQVLTPVGDSADRPPAERLSCISSDVRRRGAVLLLAVTFIVCGFCLSLVALIRPARPSPEVVLVPTTSTPVSPSAPPPPRSDDFLAFPGKCERAANHPGYPAKRGLSISPNKKLAGTCYDAKALRLDCNWYYNWGFLPRTLGCPNGTRFSAEFVPMIWGCWRGDCTRNFPADWKEQWETGGARVLMGFNEPDNVKMSNLTPEQAAAYWPQLDTLARSFEPRLKLVGPAMTSWDTGGSSDWLEQFFGNLTKLHGQEMANRIDFLGQHDFSGNADRIIIKAKAAYRRYGRKVYLSEFAVISLRTGGRRAPNNDFMREVLPLLDKTDVIERYAWFSTVNDANVITYVGETSLLKYAGATNIWRDAWGSITTTGEIYAGPQI